MRLVISLLLFFMSYLGVKSQEYIIEKTGKLTYSIIDLNDSTISIQTLGSYEDDFGTFKGYSFFTYKEKVKFVDKSISDFCKSEFKFKGGKIENSQIVINAYGYRGTYSRIIRTYENMSLSEFLKEVLQYNRNIDLVVISKMSFELNGEKCIIRDLLVFNPISLPNKE